MVLYKVMVLSILFQSTHPHGVRPRHSQKFGCSFVVSIHAPTRGATDFRRGYCQFELFQSTHPHGVRPLFAPCPHKQTCFNPRTHTGCDSFKTRLLIYNSSFNPRTHTGCDNSLTVNPKAFISFNPRTHTGCDRIIFAIRTFFYSFNPRTHTGCDVNRYNL